MYKNIFCLKQVELVSRNPQELLEIVGLIAELLPKLPKEGIFLVNTMMTHPGNMLQQDAVQWQWKDDRGQWNSYSSFDSRIIEVNQCLLFIKRSLLIILNSHATFYVYQTSAKLSDKVKLMIILILVRT